MITCKDIAKEAHDLLDGDMGMMQRLRVRWHLFICKHCRNYIRQLRLTLKTLGQSHLLVPEEEPSEAEIDDIVEKLKNAKH